MTVDPADLAGALPAPEGTALFLDFDGTLVDIAETPDGVVVPSGLRDLLARLTRATGGALALVSGRSVAAIEGFLPGYDGVIIGGHGAETRRDGRVVRHRFAGSAALGEISAAAESFVHGKDGLLAERKPTGIVLHYRRAPGRQSEVEAFMQRIADAHEGVELHRAKMAAELRPDDIGKDQAVAALMAKPPFAGKTAVFFGDDATDEPAMRFCVESGGTACKVGDGTSGAPHRLAFPEHVRAALGIWAQRGGHHAKRADGATDRRIEPDSDRG